MGTGTDTRSSCPLCRGLGYLRADVPVGHPDFGTLVPCACSRAEIETRRFARLQELSGLGAELRENSFDNFRLVHHDGNGRRPVSNRAAFEAARAFAGDPRGWLVIAGGNGAGKTHLAAAIANELMGRGEVALFVSVPSLLDHLRAAFAPTAPVGFDELFERVKAVSLLILDDLGAQQGTDWAWEKLYQVLVHRRNWRLPLVVTTNLDVAAEDPGVFPDRRVGSRLCEEGWVRRVLITTPDFRRQTEIDSKCDGGQQ
jgi:DNA replication protein DnaC